MDDLVKAAWEAFQANMDTVPTMTLRAGDSLDSYRTPLPFDPEVDAPTDLYLEKYGFHALPFLDPSSWRHYLPRLIDYALRNLGNPETMVIDGLVYSLRPPDRDPPRLASLTSEQEAVVVGFLERLAFGEDALPDREMALQALDEWWITNATYRPHPTQST